MKKILKSLFILILSFLIALASYKYLDLALTLPLLSLGLGILIAQRFWGKYSIIRLIAKNIGILFSMISVCFSILNSPFIVNRLVKNKITIKQIGDVGRTGSRLNKVDADGLGYAYKPGIKNLRSHKIGVKSNGEITEIYDVIYNIDDLGNRLTPKKNLMQIDTNNGILFVGGSFTFGEGLNDDETLSYFIQKSSGRSALNAGMHGYGAHQALRILEEEKIYNKRTKGHNIKTVIYRFIVGHVKRTAGYSPWDKSGPCYEIAQSGKIEYRGSFEECNKSRTPFLSRIASSYNEPFTVKLFRRFTFEGNYFKPNFLPSEDIDRFLAVTKRMKEISQARGVSFYIILEDLVSYESCVTRDPIFEELSERLKQQDQNLILTSDVYSKETCFNNDLSLNEYDGHPSRTANKILSDYLIENNLID